MQNKKPTQEGQINNPYTDYSDDMSLLCPTCAWTGLAKDGARADYSTLFDVSCPKCFEMLLVVPYPTHEQTKEAAELGNEEALHELPFVMRREKFIENYEKVKLQSADQLPDLEGEVLEFICDVSSPEDDYLAPGNIVIKCGDIILCQEPERYEWWVRFNALKAMLKEKYGSRFKSFTPTPRARYSLYGDRLSAHSYVTFD